MNERTEVFGEHVWMKKGRSVLQVVNRSRPRLRTYFWIVDRSRPRLRMK